MSLFQPFLWLNNIPLYGGTTLYLSVHPRIGLIVVGGISQQLEPGACILVEVACGRIWPETFLLRFRNEPSNEDKLGSQCWPLRGGTWALRGVLGG